MGSYRTLKNKIYLIFIKKKYLYNLIIISFYPEKRYNLYNFDK